MVQCFVPDCNHQSESKNCSFYRFPKDLKQRKRWQKLIRREDKTPNENSRVCSCHFRDGKKENGPEIFERNCDKFFTTEPVLRKKNRKTKDSVDMPGSSEIQQSLVQMESQTNQQPQTINEIILQNQLELVSAELDKLKKEKSYAKSSYSVNEIQENILVMETGLPTKEIFWIVVNYVARFKDDLNYFYGWKVETIKLEDQIFITLMKLRHNYTNLHLASLFSCSETTISNIVVTFIHVLHKLFFEDMMGTIPSRHKNSITSPSSFVSFPNCKIIIDCTDIKISIPNQMDLQRATYSSYRSTHSFKVLIGVAPNAVINYVSKCYPGSTSDKAIFRHCGVIHHLVAGDLVIADKGFLISDSLPPGVSVNIPPFLHCSQFTENEIMQTKKIAKCRVHVERANARLKNFKILSHIPHWLRQHCDTLVQLVAALVNPQIVHSNKMTSWIPNPLLFLSEFAMPCTDI